LIINGAKIRLAYARTPHKYKILKINFFPQRADNSRMLEEVAERPKEEYPVCGAPVFL